MRSSSSSVYRSNTASSSERQSSSFGARSWNARASRDDAFPGGAAQGSAEIGGWQGGDVRPLDAAQPQAERRSAHQAVPSSERGTEDASYQMRGVRFGLAERHAEVRIGIDGILLRHRDDQAGRLLQQELVDKENRSAVDACVAWPLSVIMVHSRQIAWQREVTDLISANQRKPIQEPCVAAAVTEGQSDSQLGTECSEPVFERVVLVAQVVEQQQGRSGCPGMRL